MVSSLRFRVHDSQWSTLPVVHTTTPFLGRFVVGGDGPLRGALEALARALGLRVRRDLDGDGVVDDDGEEEEVEVEQANGGASAGRAVPLSAAAVGEVRTINDMAQKGLAS